jgi:hypothetical protein
LDARLEQYVAIKHTTRSEVMRLALEEYLKRQAWGAVQATRRRRDSLQGLETVTTLRMAEWTGQGVDRVYREVLRLSQPSQCPGSGVRVQPMWCQPAAPGRFVEAVIVGQFLRNRGQQAGQHRAGMEVPCQ